MANLILGSASPRRRDLLQALGIAFEIDVAHVDEDQITLSNPGQNVLARAQLKAQALRDRYLGENLILTADTTVALGHQILNKPQGREDAIRMLKSLRGQTHQVYTGMILIDLSGTVYERLSQSDVKMRPYTDREIEAYVGSGDPMDKAGAYAIQHAGFHPVEEIDQCFAGIMGLGVCQLLELFSLVELGSMPNLSHFTKKVGEGLCPYCISRFNRLLD
ncbi:MAG: Maf family protein [Chloroflexota bacterium]